MCCGEVVADDADLQTDQHPSNFCGECNRYCCPLTCTVDEGEETLCKLCDWVRSAEHLAEQEDGAQREMEVQAALWTSLRVAEASSSPTKKKWTNNLLLRRGTVSKLPNMFCAPTKPKQVGGKKVNMICWYSIIDYM